MHGEKFKEFAELKEEVHKLRMEENNHEEEVEITLDDFFLTLAKFASKKSATYSFIDNAGLKFKLAFFKLCKKLIKNEAFSESFDSTTLVQLPKKGLAATSQQFKVHTHETVASKAGRGSHCKRNEGQNPISWL